MLRRLTTVGLIIGAVGCAAATSSCALFVDDREQVETWLNSQLGKPIGRTSILIYPHERKDVAADKEEYILGRGYKGCRFAFLVDKSTRLVNSWRYLSESKLCWSHIPSA